MEEMDFIWVTQIISINSLDGIRVTRDSMNNGTKCEKFGCI